MSTIMSRLMGRLTSILLVKLAVDSFTSMSIIVRRPPTMALTSAADLHLQKHVHLHQLGVVEFVRTL
eukprot:1510871-Heterocapsa_arctica.AAC.1